MDANVLAMLQQLGAASGGKGQPSLKALMDMIMSGQYGALTDTYTGGQQQSTGYMPTPQVAMPTAYDYLNSKGPMADIVQQLLSNDPATHITPDAANRLLMTQINDANSPLYGQDAAFLTGQLNKVMGEINNYSALQAKQQYAASQPDPHNPFTKAGLPTPDQRWDANSAPYSETQFMANARKQEQMKLDDLAQMYEIQKDANGNYDTSSKYSTMHYAPNAGKHGIAIDPAKIKAAKSGNDAVGVDDSTLRKAFDAVKHSFGWPANGQPLTLDDSQLADFKGKMLQFLQQSDAKRIPEMKARGLEQKYID